MQKIWKSFFLWMICSFLILQPLAKANTNPIHVHVNSIDIQVDENIFEGNRFVYEGTIYLPMRSLAEALGYPVHFYNETKTAYIGRLPADELPVELVKRWNAITEPPAREPEALEPEAQVEISAYINPITIKVNGRKVETDNFLYKSTTYVPMRAVAEMLNIEVVYYEQDKTAYFGSLPEELISEDWVSVLNLSRNHHVFYLSHNPDEEMYVFYDHINQQDLDYVHVPDSILNSSKQEWTADGIRMKRIGETIFFHKDDLIRKQIIAKEE